MDGYVSIGVVLDDKEFDRELNRLEKLTDKKRKLDVETGFDGKLQRDIDRFEREYQNMWDRLDKVQSEKEWIDKNALRTMSGDNFLYQRDEDKYRTLTEEAKKLDLKIASILDKQQASKNQLSEKNLQLQNTQKEIDAINTKLDNSKKKTESLGFGRIREDINKVGQGISGIVKKVGRWALAIFGVRSIYMSIRRLTSTLSRYNMQLKADLEYINFAIAKAFEPLILRIIDLVFKLLAYVNYIAKAWFGINLFANSSASAFEQANSSIGGAVDNAKKLRKELNQTSFDEMNTLADNSSDSGGSGSVGGIGGPSTDLSQNIEDIPIPKWIEEIAKIGKFLKENWKLALLFAGAIGLLAIGFKLLFRSTAGVGSFVKGLMSAITTIATLGGMALVIKTLTDLIIAFSESGLTLSEVGILIAVALGSIAVAFTVMSLAAKTMDWQSLAGAAVILGGLALVLHKVTKLLDAFTDSGLSVNEMAILMATIFVPIIALMGAIALLGPMMTAGLIPFLAVIGGISAILLVLKATLPTILNATGNFIEKTAPSLVLVLNTIGKILDRLLNTLGVVLPPIVDSVGRLFNTVFEGIAKVVTTVGNTLIRILQTLERLVVNVLDAILRFVRQLGPAIETFVGSVIRSITKLINFLISGIEYMVNTLVIDGVNSIIRALNKISGLVGVQIPTVAPFYIPRFVPRLATGGIINYPNKGVSLGGMAVGGEAGAEGVIPLTDSQAMETLGHAIGKYITVNANIVTQMNGRTINRELKRINNEENFAMNGGY